MTAAVKGIVAQARRAAQKRGQQASTAHLLLVMLQSGGPVARLLSDQGVRETHLLEALRTVTPESSSAFERALERSDQLAAQYGGDPSAWHLLLAITRDARSAGHRSLASLGMGPSSLHREVLHQLGHQPQRRREPSAPTIPPPPGMRTAPRREVRPRRKRPTKKAEPTARRKKRARPAARRDPSRAPAQLPNPEPIEPVVVAPSSPLALDPERFPTLAKLGRNLTQDAADGILDPLIGRDAEIELILDVLARRRANNPVLVGPPGVGKTAVVEGLAQRLAAGVPGLEGRILVELSAGALVSGTGIRGALADRMRKIRDEVRTSGGRLILFLDEIHAVVGGDGPDDLVSELKGSLARGELCCVGATTEREYRKHIEKDPALARRLAPVQIDEPAPADAVAILEGLAPRYEEHHEVSFDGEAIRSAVELSQRFLHDRFLPDKAVGVLDLAAARVRRRGGDSVDREAVASVIAEQARVPLERLMMKDGERLLKLESLLGERVVGHAAVLTRIASALRKSAARVRGERPLGTFLFLGPTGVGKTETAKAISEIFFPGTPMTRLDMSEMSESHGVARMLGAPPGYVGHDEGGQLTEAVRRRPYQLVLLDEIEKAHPEVLLSLLPLLDEGRLTDGKGRTARFSNTIVVLTSNLGASAGGRRSIGFGEENGHADAMARTLEAARRAMPPELWNRIDEPLFFGALGRADVAEIARRMLEKVAATVAERGLTVRFEDSVVDCLIDAGGWDPSLGARPMRRLIGRLVESPLASALLAGELGRGETVTLVADSGRIRW